mgnify:CR=1 FL=1
MNNSTKEMLLIQDIHLQAFESDGPLVSNMAKEMLSQSETISINVERDGKVVGNIIFTPFKLNDHPDKKCFLLAPLGVLPEFQKQGVGKELIEKGVLHLKSIGTDAIFVMGHPDYYELRGFVTTEVIPPYDELVTFYDGWKMLEIQPGSMAEVGGTSVAADPIMKPIFWDTSEWE